MLSCHAKDQCHVKVVKTSTSVMLFPKMLARPSDLIVSHNLQAKDSDDSERLKASLLTSP